MFKLFKFKNKRLYDKKENRRFIYKQMVIPLNIDEHVRSFTSDGREEVSFSVKLIENPPDSFSTSYEEFFTKCSIARHFYGKRVYFICAKLDVVR